MTSEPNTSTVEPNTSTFELSWDQFFFLKDYKQKNPTHSWPRVYDSFCKHFHHNEASLEEVQAAYSSAKKDIKFICPNDLSYWSQTRGIKDKTYTQFLANPNTYLYRKPVPGVPSVHGPFTVQEIELFKRLIPNLHSQPHWGLISILFPGRAGYQLNNLYSQLLEQGEIQEIQIPQKEKDSFQDQRALSDQQEQDLSQFIKNRFNNHQRTTVQMISQEARNLFFQAEPLAERAAKIHFQNENIDPSNSNFIQYKQRAKEAYIADPSAFFETYQVREFKASHTWTLDFMKRNNFSVRQAHVKRRGQVKDADVQTYLNELREAFQTYGEELVFNMDETSIYVNMQPPTTVAPTGSKDIYININSNEKERFTAIGTCTKLRTYPMIILAKGSTEKCEEKFGRLDFSLTFHTPSGWTDQDVMIQYLTWLSEQVEGRPCALVLDAYRAHFSQAVVEYAKKLNIKLIRVPPNGTGQFQPLDRCVYGAFKSKLKSIAEESENRDERFKKINAQLISCWKAVSQKCLESAWAVL